MNYVVRMLAMIDCGYSPVHGFTVVVALQCWSKNKSKKQTTFHNRLHNRLFVPRAGRGKGCCKMVWAFSVHTTLDIKKESVINVVCYERVWYEQACYEHGLLWKWCVLNRSVMNGSVVNLVCFEWSVMNGSVLNGNHFEVLLCFYESRVSNFLL